MYTNQTNNRQKLYIKDQDGFIFLEPGESCDGEPERVLDVAPEPERENDEQDTDAGQADSNASG